MAKDYAKMYSGRNRRDPGKGPPYVLLGVVCLAIGAAVAMFFHGMAPHFLSGEALALRARLNLPQAAATVAKQPAAIPAQDPVKFDFYSELPAMNAASVVTSKPQAPIADRKSVTVALLPKSVASARQAARAGNYVLQLGFFSDQRAAAQTRLNFLLAGVDSLIVKEKTASGQVVYRIQQGPYVTEHAARIAQAHLRRKGIDGLVRKTEDG